jgi:hypothetical protein
MIDSRAMFRGLYEALRWTWYGSIDASNTVRGPAWAQYQSIDKRDRDQDEAPARSRDPDVGGVPRGLLAAGQAGALKGHVEAMSQDEACHIMAQFLKGREKVLARKHLRRYVSDYIGAQGRDRHAVSLLLIGYYGAQSISARSVSKKLGINRGRVNKLNRRIFITMDALAHRAETEIYDELQKRGVVL